MGCECAGPGHAGIPARRGSAAQGRARPQLQRHALVGIGQPNRGAFHRIGRARPWAIGRQIPAGLRVAAGQRLQQSRARRFNLGACRVRGEPEHEERVFDEPTDGVLGTFRRGHGGFSPTPGGGAKFPAPDEKSVGDARCRGGPRAASRHDRNVIETPDLPAMPPRRYRQKPRAAPQTSPPARARSRRCATAIRLTLGAPSGYLDRERVPCVARDAGGHTTLKHVKIVGTGVGLPAKVLTNADLERMVDTSDAWITERTGIKERRIAEAHVATSDLCAEAVRNACADAGISPHDLDALIVGTSTADTLFPSTACWTQGKLGVKGMAAFDVSAGCSGFLYGLELATSLVVSKSARRVAVVGGEVMSKVVNWEDRGTCVLFGDGAGAAIVTEGDGRAGVLASNWGADGGLAPILYQPAGGTQQPATHETVDARGHTVHMEGNTVFKHAVVAMSNGAIAAMREAEITPDDVTLLIPHQANQRIMEAARERTGISRDKLFSVLHKYGNMSAATIPVAIHEARTEGRLVDDAILVMTAFGTGFTWGACVLRW
jgi:3-oxoacyl-[acyl-carrier-protein] synthase III